MGKAAFATFPFLILPYSVLSVFAFFAAAAAVLYRLKKTNEFRREKEIEIGSDRTDGRMEQEEVRKKRGGGRRRGGGGGGGGGGKGTSLEFSAAENDR